MHKAIIHILERLAEKEATLKRWKEQTNLAWVLLGVAVLFLILLFAAKWWSFIGCVALLCVAFGFWIWGGRSINPSFDANDVAHKIEESHPDLQALLLTAVEQKPDETGELTYLQDRVVKEAISQAREQDWIEDVSTEEMNRAERASRWARRAAALVVFLPLVLGFSKFGPSGMIPQSMKSSDTLDESVAQSESIPDEAVEVAPGNAEVEKGSRLPISALFGKGMIPVEANLLYGTDEASLQTLPMVKSLEDPLFGVILPEVNEDFVYQIGFGEKKTETYKITTFEYPRLDVANITITP
ncbi:MAG: hypothetical protein ACKVHP_13850, partial [Verrucomicrobiales bacterium]